MVAQTQGQSLGQEDPLEEGMATHAGILAWRIPWTEEPGGLQSMGSQRIRPNWAYACMDSCPKMDWEHFGRHGDSSYGHQSSSAKGRWCPGPECFQYTASPIRSNYRIRTHRWAWALEFSSVQFSCSVMSDSLQPHELQHARPPCPSPTPGERHFHSLRHWSGASSD